MTFTMFVAKVDHMVQDAARDRSWVAHLDQSSIHATWTSGSYAVGLSPVDSDVTVVRFTEDGVEAPQHDQPGWTQSADSASELALAMTRYFSGHGLALS